MLSCCFLIFFFLFLDARFWRFFLLCFFLRSVIFLIFGSIFLRGFFLNFSLTGCRLACRRGSFCIFLLILSKAFEIDTRGNQTKDIIPIVVMVF